MWITYITRDTVPQRDSLLHNAILIHTRTRPAHSLPSQSPTVATPVPRRLRRCCAHPPPPPSLPPPPRRRRAHPPSSSPSLHGGDHACRGAPPLTGCPAISSRNHLILGRYHPIPRKYHAIYGRNRMIPDKYHMIPRGYHAIRDRNRLIHDRYRMIPREYHAIRG
uniref:Uncharacterized protein n=1 Tax=Oryza nivara TaxID=4536 RepID=A0A0E0FUM8_ORYNI